MENSQNEFEGGDNDNTRMNLIISAATEFVDDVLEQVRMLIEMDDHSMRSTVNNSLVERDSAIIDGSLGIAPREFIDGLVDEIVYSTMELNQYHSAVELSQYHSSESVISDDNQANDDADGIILHLSTSAAVQFESARELVVASSRYFNEDRASLETGVISIASVDQINRTDVSLPEKRHPIERRAKIPLRIGFQVPEESSASSENEEKTWVSDQKQICPLELQSNHPFDERQLWPSVGEEEMMVVTAGTNEARSDIEEVVTEPTPKKRKSFLSALGRRILSMCRMLCCCGDGGRRTRLRSTGHTVGMNI